MRPKQGLYDLRKNISVPEHVLILIELYWLLRVNLEIPLCFNPLYLRDVGKARNVARRKTPNNLEECVKCELMLLFRTTIDLALRTVAHRSTGRGTNFGSAVDTRGDD
jgi:hypothetical protein